MVKAARRRLAILPAVGSGVYRMCFRRYVRDLKPA